MGSEFFENFSNSQREYVCEFDIDELTLGQDAFETIYAMVGTCMTGNRFLGGIALYNPKGAQMMTISRNPRVAEDYQTLSEIVSQMEPEVFFKALPDTIEKDGLGHLKFDYFEIIFSQISQGDSISFFIMDHASNMYEILGELFGLLSEILDFTPREVTEIYEEAKREQKRTPEPTVSSPQPKISSPTPEISAPEPEYRSSDPTLSEPDTISAPPMKSSEPRRAVKLAPTPTQEPRQAVKLAPVPKDEPKATIDAEEDEKPKTTAEEMRLAFLKKGLGKMVDPEPEKEEEKVPERTGAPKSKDQLKEMLKEKLSAIDD